MATRIGQRTPHGEFEDLADAVTDFGSETASREDARGVGKPPKKRSGGGLLSSAAFAAVVSFIALAFSSYSFYETVLKAPDLRIYAPPQVHMFRDAYRDVFAVPITLSNDGARRGTVLSYALTARHRETGETMRFQGRDFGKSPDDEAKAMFTPVTVAGRDSDTHLVIFTALKTGSFVETTGGVELPLDFELTAHIERREGDVFAPPEVPPIRFSMTAPFIQGFNDMERGRPTALFDERWVSERRAAAATPETDAD